MFSKLFKYSISNKKSDRELTYGDLFAAYTKMVTDSKKIVITQERIVDDLLVTIYKKTNCGSKAMLGHIWFYFHTDKVAFDLDKCCGVVGPDEEFYEDALTLIDVCRDRVKNIEDACKAAKKVQEQKKLNSAIQQAKRCM